MPLLQGTPINNKLCFLLADLVMSISRAQQDPEIKIILQDNKIKKVCFFLTNDCLLIMVAARWLDV
jgi:hypothetical protein